ncbi:thiolase-like protein, partial [Aspergillus avenaceus]
MPVAPSSDAPTPATISVVGTASQYPSNQHEPEFLPQLSKRHYAHSSAYVSIRHSTLSLNVFSLEKTLEIHMRTKIEKRYSVLPDTHPLWHQDKVPTVTECIAISEQYGLPLAKAAAKEAIAEWGGDIQGITHVIAVTCSGGSSPRFDSALCKHLGMSQHARRILIDGMTCAGSVAALRTAYELLLGATCVGQPGRALVIACETMSIYNRAWLDHIVTQQTPNLAPTLFGDCSSAVVLSNMIGVKDTERPPIWQIIGAQPTLTTVSGVIGDNIVPTG